MAILAFHDDQGSFFFFPGSDRENHDRAIVAESRHGTIPAPRLDQVIAQHPKKRPFIGDL